MPERYELEVAVADALRRDERLAIGWDSSVRLYGLFDKDSGECVIHGKHKFDDTDWTRLRAVLIVDVLNEAATA